MILDAGPNTGSGRLGSVSGATPGPHLGCEEQEKGKAAWRMQEPPGKINAFVFAPAGELRRAVVAESSAGPCTAQSFLPSSGSAEGGRPSPRRHCLGLAQSLPATRLAGRRASGRGVGGVGRRLAGDGTANRTRRIQTAGWRVRVSVPAGLSPEGALERGLGKAGGGDCLDWALVPGPCAGRKLPGPVGRPCWRKWGGLAGSRADQQGWDP